MSDKKNNIFKNKKVIIIGSVVISLVIIVLLIVFFANKIPSKYYGKYLRYYYKDDGTYTTTMYEISALSVKETEEDGSNSTVEQKLDYKKSGDDLIISLSDQKYYLIVEDDKLFVNSSKDISLDKEYNFFYWNVKSDKADIYEIQRLDYGLETQIEKTMNTWARKLIDAEDNDYSFYITSSDSDNDDTDLNEYSIEKEAAGGKITFYYSRGTKKLTRVYFSGSVLTTSYFGKSEDTMSAKDISDARALLLSLMYVLGNKEKIELNVSSDDTEKLSEYISDLSYRLKVTLDYDDLFKNKTVDSKYKTRYTYNLSNEKYDIDYNSWIDSSDYSVNGIISFNISFKE